MTLGADPVLASALVSQLDTLRAMVLAGEDDVLACLVVTGEPRPQRVLDDWLDQVTDTLRALGETACDLTPSLSRWVDGPRGDAAAAPQERTGARSAPQERTDARSSHGERTGTSADAGVQP
ncbi:MAG: hypothetical protein ABIQ61_00750 [Ornithinibacter sp.]